MSTQHGANRDIWYGSAEAWFTPDIQGSMSEHKVTDARCPVDPESKQ